MVDFTKIMISVAERDKLVATYHNQGYVKVADAIPIEKIQALERAINHVAAEFSEKNEDRNEVGIRIADTSPHALHEFTQVLRMSPEFHAIETELQKVVRYIYECSTVITIQSNILMGSPKDNTLFDWHQEASYIAEPDEFVNFWYPLFDDASEDNGAMRMLEGSHIDGTLPYNEVRKPQENGPDIVEQIPSNIKTLREECREVRSTISRGDVIVMHPDLVHRSSDNRSESVRFTGTTKIAPIDGIEKKVSDIVDIPH